jgi:hypothetical protein
LFYFFNLFLLWVSNVGSSIVGGLKCREGQLSGAQLSGHQRYGCYIVLLESSRKMLCSLWTDLTAAKVQCGECLCETKRMRDWVKGMDVTLFCWRAVAICCAPSSPIWLLPRFSVVSVYVKQKEWDIGWKVGILHCFVGGQWQDYVPLHYRFDCLEGEVWWVSMWNKKNERLDEKVWMLHCFVGEQWQDVVLLHHRSDCLEGRVCRVSIWSGKKVSVNKDLQINFINEFWNTRNCVFQLMRCILKRNYWVYYFPKREDWKRLLGGLRFDLCFV